MASSLEGRCSPVYTTGVRRPPQSGALVPDTPAHHPQNTTKGDARRVMGDGLHVDVSPAPCNHETGDTVSVQETGTPSSHTPIRAKRPTPDSRTLPPSRDETIRPRPGVWSRTLQDRPLNRETLSDRPTLPTVPQRATDHPEHTVERGKHDSQTSPEDDYTRVDDEPFHHEADRTSTSVTTTRKPVPGPYAARVVERARERDAITERHFQSDLSS